MAQYVVGWALIISSAAFLAWTAWHLPKRRVRYRCGGCRRLHRTEAQAVECVRSHWDMRSSASRQHYIDTGEYLPVGWDDWDDE